MAVIYEVSVSKKGIKSICLWFLPISTWESAKFRVIEGLELIEELFGY